MNWDKPPATCSAEARPLRVAYLVDLSTATGKLFDAIAADACFRWGGRFSLIVPCSSGGIDPRYRDWLLEYDPDIIYTYVEIDSETQERLHDDFSPLLLLRHLPRRLLPEDVGYYIPELPQQGLSALSILPSLAADLRYSHDAPGIPKLLDKESYRSHSEFLSTNFGFMSDSFPNVSAFKNENIFQLIALDQVSDPKEKNQHQRRFSSCYATEKEIIEEIAKNRGILGAMEISALASPYLDMASVGQSWTRGLNIVISSTSSDRILFWNGRSHSHRRLPWEISTMLIERQAATNEEFWKTIIPIIKARACYGATGGSNHHIVIRSSSVENETLEHIRGIVLGIDRFLQIEIIKDEDHTACLPVIEHPAWVSFRNTTLPYNQVDEDVVEFAEDRVHVPLVVPWHLKHFRFPQRLAEGCWMLDVSLSRTDDHSRYSNTRHSWHFPRRLRIDHAFEIDRRPERQISHVFHRTRIDRRGRLSIPSDYGQKSLSLEIPDDFMAFRFALCEFSGRGTFFGVRGSLERTPGQFRACAVSDKGKYQLGVIERFKSLEDTFSILMHHFWMDLLHSLGAAPPSQTAETLKKELIQKLRKKLRKPNGPILLNDVEAENHLATQAIQVARHIQNDARYVRYGDLKSRWGQLAERSRRESEEGGKVLDYEGHLEEVDSTLKTLCQKEIFFQGIEWQCRKCLNRNWTTIDALSKLLKCNVCRKEEPAPVTGEWHFRPNEFLVSAYREQGVEAVLFAIYNVWKRARLSFYFLPSFNLKYKTDSLAGENQIEIDLLMIVDGKIYLCEAKSSGRLSKVDREKLLIAARAIKPDVLLLVTMEDNSDKMDKEKNYFSRLLPEGILVEIIHRELGALDGYPGLF